ncbi:MAG TPA: diaminopimelate decarboxylase [Chthonomonadaceae bacterium]|nr:diaminopimelate decarboxylase [Chthonomonadaceae bacterium]
MLLGTQRIDAQGHLEIGGCDTTRLAAEFGTPLYVMDEAAIRANCRRYRAAFEARYPQNAIYYASKAFLTLAMARLIAQEGLGMDVAALGELYTALEAGFPVERLALHGNNKSREELELAVSHRIGHIIVDNFHEMDLLGQVVAEAGATVNVLIRTTPGVDPVTHRLIRTGQADTKFGFNIMDGSALQAVKRVLATPGLQFRGLHCHIGSQLLDAETHVQAVEIMVGLMRAVVEETGAPVEELNIGGGLGVRYLPEDCPPSYEAFAEQIATTLKRALDAAGLPYPRLGQEPGRALVAEAGTTLYMVGAIKTVPITEAPGARTYVAIDGGMSDNPRPQLYEAAYSCLLANKADQSPDEVVTIAGKHCETDILIWNARLARPEPGDLLAVQTTGAYNYVMASNYNRFLRPAIVFVADGQADLIVERESLEDLIQRERLPSRLRATSTSTNGRNGQESALRSKAPSDFSIQA